MSNSGKIIKIELYDTDIWFPGLSNNYNEVALVCILTTVSKL